VWYADLVQALARAADADANIVVRRRCRVVDMEQQPDSVLIRLEDSSSIQVSIAINAEGAPANGHTASGEALLADLDVDVLPPAPPWSVSHAKVHSHCSRCRRRPEAASQ